MPADLAQQVAIVYNAKINFNYLVEAEKEGIYKSLAGRLHLKKNKTFCLIDGLHKSYLFTNNYYLKIEYQFKILFETLYRFLL